MNHESGIASQTGRTRMRAYRREMTVVLRRVLEGTEAAHREPGHGPAVVLGIGAEICIDPRQQLTDVERLPVAWSHELLDRF